MKHHIFSKKKQFIRVSRFINKDTFTINQKFLNLKILKLTQKYIFEKWNFIGGEEGNYFFYLTYN